jgi:FkbM family methyltransferase
MLIKFKDICEKYQFVPKGIIHVGAHELEEMSDYMEMGVNNIVWIEGNPSLVEQGFQKINGSNQKLFNALIYDADGIELDFNITNNLQSSSILEFGKHLEYHPHVEFTHKIKMETSTIKSLLMRENITSSEFDFINLDIQGVELKALKGMGDYIKDIKYVYTEINTGEVYKENNTLKEMDDFLDSEGFKRVETNITPFEWGDAFYIRK